MDDHLPSVSVPSRKTSFYSAGVSTGGIILRAIIVFTGFLALVLGSIGSPNDLRSYNEDSESNDRNTYYGYGFGYITEPLNAVYISIVIITFLTSIVVPTMLLLKRTLRMTAKLNRIVYACMGGFLLLGSICGGIGCFYFWRGCCHVSLPDPSGDRGYIQYKIRKTYTGEAKTHWCQCLYWLDSSGSEPHREKFFYEPGFGGSNIISAEPHHFVIHAVSMGVSLVTAVLSFVAVAFV